MDWIDELLWWFLRVRVLLCWVPGILGGLVLVIMAVLELRRRSEIEKTDRPRLAVTIGIDHYPGCWRHHDECAENLIEQAIPLLRAAISLPRTPEPEYMAVVRAWLRDVGEDGTK